MSKRVCWKFVLVICCVGIALFLFQAIQILSLLEEEINLSPFKLNNDGWNDEKEQIGHPILLWWTPFTGEKGTVHQCGKEKCFFTQNRNYLNSNMLQAILFYGSDFNPLDLPLPRKENHDWALLHEESPKNNYLFCTKEVMELFNHTATFRRESDFPVTLQYLDSLNSLTKLEYLKTTEEKDRQLKNLSSIVYVQSDCNTPSERDAYVSELMKYIKIDSYGKCLHNKDLPLRLSDPIEGMDSLEFWELLSKYKFSLAFENAICQDYITEKLWRPLIIGSVPIYYGSPTVQDWLPDPNSAIIVKDFDSPKTLADYLHYLNSNRTAYELHLHHKLQQTITNTHLQQAMQKRKWGINNDFEKGNFIEHFECFVCERVSRNYKARLSGILPNRYQATIEHYGCPMPTSAIKDRPVPTSWWAELYNRAKFEASALRQLMNQSPTFTEKEFYDQVLKLLQS